MLNSCCCMRINTAGIVIGWIGAVGSFIYVVLTSLVLANLDDAAHSIAQAMNATSADEQILRTRLLIVASIYLPIHVINLISSALLVLGTVKERHLLLVPWLLNYGIIMIISTFIGLTVVVGLSENLTFDDALLPLIIIILSLMFQFYIWYAIYSLFKKLQTNRETRPLLLPTSGASYPSYTKI